MSGFGTVSGFIHPTVQVISSFSETIALMQEEHADRAAKEVIEKG